ncbi:putative rapid ALkalinization Factor [Lupinus albus]|uniref:Putative rapid ALkalinization Factor n=1 Tax=Lupinus albus TaxID=3870 RepID=A0A6A4NWD5_LUPAL|nr:putative rapid ALkalinization Factor [Lupinus albus]
MGISKEMRFLVLLLGVLLTSSLFTVDVEALNIGNLALLPDHGCGVKGGISCPLPRNGNPPSRGCSPINRCRGSTD